MTQYADNRHVSLDGQGDGIGGAGATGTASSFLGLPQGFLLSQGLGMAGGLMKWLGSRGRRKKAENLVGADRGALQGMIGEKPYNATDIAFGSRQQALANVRPSIERAGRSSGLGSSAFASDTISDIATQGRGLYADATMRSGEIVSQNKLSILDRLLGNSEDQLRNV